MGEYYAVIRSPDFIAHYGIKGMKWGVRKFVKDKHANPSDKFNSLYGDKATKTVGPRTMQRHFNAIDKSTANIIAKKRAKEIEFGDLINNRNFIEVKKNKVNKGKSKNKDRKLAKLNKASNAITKKMSSTFSKGVDHAYQVKNLESMMDSIAAKAANSGYTVRSKDKLYMPYAYISTRGAYGVIPVGGQHVKIRKHGDGHANFTMYKEHGNGDPYNVNLSTGKITRKKKRK